MEISTKFDTITLYGRVTGYNFEISTPGYAMLNVIMLRWILLSYVGYWTWL